MSNLEIASSDCRPKLTVGDIETLAGVEYIVTEVTIHSDFSGFIAKLQDLKSWQEQCNWKQEYEDMHPIIEVK
jgi:hypothetical protein